MSVHIVTTMMMMVMMMMMIRMMMMMMKMVIFEPPMTVQIIDNCVEDIENGEGGDNDYNVVYI